MRSPNIAQGYLGSDFPTSAAYVNMSSAIAGQTGDQLHLAGRGDDTVKIRGYRVDVSEVVGAIEAIPEVAEAAVLARHGTGGAELIALPGDRPGVRPRPSPRSVPRWRRRCRAGCSPPTCYWWPRPAH